MAVKFIIGRAGTGKTTRCLDQIRERLQAEPLGSPLILLVPEQATFQAEHALVTTPGLNGMMRAQVLSFRRLALRVMQETGGSTLLPIDDMGKRMLLHRILHQRLDELRLFHRTADRMGFIAGLSELFNEFKQYQISARLLTQFLDESPAVPSMLADKIHDLLLLYGDYFQTLSEHYVDSEDNLTLLARQLADSVFVAGAQVWIDGFYRFTPQESAVIEQLMRHCRNLTITLCLDRDYDVLDKPDELDLFYPTAQALVRFKRQLLKLGITADKTELLTADHGQGKFKENPLVAQLENSFARPLRGSGKKQTDRQDGRELPDRQNQQSGRFIVLNEAASRRMEIEGAAKRLIRLVQSGKMRWRDILVLMRNIEDYQDLMIAVFEDYRIPFFFDQKRSVQHHPLVELIRSAVETVNGNWRYDAVFRCIKTDLLFPEEIPIDEARRGMDKLENTVLAFGIQGTRWTDGKPWAFTWKQELEPAEPEQQYGSEAGQREPDKEQRERIEQQQLEFYRQIAVQALVPFQQQFKQAQTVREFVAALYDLLEQLHVADKLRLWSEACMHKGQPEQAKEHAQLWDRVIDMFDQMVEVVGDQEMRSSLFAEILETGLESIQLSLVPPSLDQVLIGSIDRTRSDHVKACFVLGVNDGVIPGSKDEEGVLSESERELLTESGVQLAPGGKRKLLDERFLLYSTLTAASHWLWLSYPLADNEGASLLPSELIHQLIRLFPYMPIRSLSAAPLHGVANDEQFDAEYLIEPDQVLSELAIRLQEHVQGAELPQRWLEVYEWVRNEPDLRERLRQRLVSISYTNREAPLSMDLSGQLYGERLTMSVSRMEKFASCAFAHFAQYGLKLRERKVYRLDAPDIGQLFHAALSLMAKQMLENGIDWGALSAEECRRQAAKIVEQIAPRLWNEILFSSARHHDTARKLTETIGQTAVILGKQAQVSSFAPVGLELDFGPRGALPALHFSLENRIELEIIGRIDRVDQAEGEQETWLRVIDYKSGQKALKLVEVYYGLSLQMLVYLDVAVTHAKRWLGKQALPAGVLYFHVHNPLLSAANALPPQKAEAELLKKFKTKGLLLADQNAIRLMDHSLSTGYSRFLPVAVKADGSFYASSSVAEPAAWQTIRRYVRWMIRQIGRKMSAGHVEIEPYRLGMHTACDFCSFKPVCQFEPMPEGNRFRTLQTPSADELWDRFRQAVGDAAETEE